MAAPTALSLIAVTFPEGRSRNRAVAVHSAMAILGIVAGLIAGGLLVTYLSWRWVLFVNVPIGLAVAAMATRVLPQSVRRAGRFDLPGALTATAGVAALVYGLKDADPIGGGAPGEQHGAGLVQLPAGAGEQDQVGPGVGQAERDSAADAAPGTGDKGGLASEVDYHCGLPFVGA
jgi:MFS family permease